MQFNVDWGQIQTFSRVHIVRITTGDNEAFATLVQCLKIKRVFVILVNQWVLLLFLYTYSYWVCEFDLPANTRKSKLNRLCLLCKNQLSKNGSWTNYMKIFISKPLGFCFENEALGNSAVGQELIPCSLFICSLFTCSFLALSSPVC